MPSRRPDASPTARRSWAALDVTDAGSVTLGPRAAGWQAAIGDSIKPSTRQNYADYIRAYVDPIIGDRRLEDVTVPVLNLLYRRLLTEGRVKTDRNSTMFGYWSEHQAERDGLGPTPAELVAACGVSIYAARAAVLRFRRGRCRPTPGQDWHPRP